MIRVEKLSKYYGGARALGPVSFQIEDGECVGFLGLNGAGKTTALRVLACDLRPSAGTVTIDGIDAVAEPHEVRKRIGFQPENPPLYPDMRVSEYLRFSGELRGMRSAELKKRLPEVIDTLDLGEVAQQVIGTLSHGFKQRVSVAQAIVHGPKLLILDEPTRGLDPVQIVEMRGVIGALKKSHTVLISSHILTEISQTCDRLLILGRGEILGAGTEAELAARGEARQVVVGVRGTPAKDVTAALEKIAGVTSVGAPVEQAGVQQYTLGIDKDVRAEVGRAVVGAGWDLVELRYAHSELEDTFIRLVGGTDASN